MSYIARSFQLLIVVLLLSVSILRAQYSPENPAPTKEWTFIIYMDGDNNLEPDALGDFLEMSSIGSDNNINIVLLLDRSGSYVQTYDNWTDTRRGLVSSSDIPNSSWGESLGEINMGDPANLKDFIFWASQSYPSRRNVLILWNHGTGWSDYYASVEAMDYLSRTGSLHPVNEPEEDKAICQDATSFDELTLSEMKTVLDELASEESIYIDFFGMDACLMGMVEVAAEFEGQANYFIASPARIPLDGWPYDTIFDDLQINPFMSDSDLCSTIVQRFYQSYISDVCLAAFDMTFIGDIAEAIDNLGNTIMSSWQSEPEQCLFAAQSLQNQIDAALVAEAHYNKFPDSHGISINFPTTGSEDEYTNNSMQFVSITSWPTFLDYYQTIPESSWVKAARNATLKYDDTFLYYDIYDFASQIIAVSPTGVSISPSSGFSTVGEAGGPFSIVGKEYELHNSSPTEVDWSVSGLEDWLEISPSFGSLAAGATQNITITINEQATETLETGEYRSELIFIDNVYGKTLQLDIQLAVGLSDNLTELFDTRDGDNFDLSYKTITFTPEVGQFKYRTCLTEAGKLDEDTANATLVSMSDDDYKEISIGGSYLSLFGKVYDKLYVGSNGYLTFDEPDTEYDETISNHFSQPRISALFDDLDPSISGSEVSYEVSDEKLTITFLNVPQTYSALGNTFQYQLYFDGVIKITWLNIASVDALVGISDGQPRSSNINESNFSDYSYCITPSDIPLAISGNLSVVQDSMTSILLSAYDDGEPAPLEYIIDSMPFYGRLFDGETEITYTPYTLGVKRVLQYLAPSEYTGIETIVWHAFDSKNTSDSASINIDVLPKTSFFTEQFQAGQADLSGLSITFTPDNSENYYSTCHNTITELPTIPEEGIRIFNGSGYDESVYNVNINNGKTVLLYGAAWDNFNICTNGYISFGDSESIWVFSFAEHFNIPRISMFFTDLNPSYGGEVYYQQLSDRMVVSFVDVMEFSTAASHTFQAEMFFDGDIRLSWLDVAGNSTTAGTGLSDGSGTPEAFIESDFSNIHNVCDTTTPPIALDQSIELAPGSQLAIKLEGLYAEGYTITSLPHEGNIYIGQELISSVPYDLGADDIVLYIANNSADYQDEFSWYAYNYKDSELQVSNNAAVSINIYQCSELLPPYNQRPIDGLICFPLNRPLIWEMTNTLSKTKTNFSSRSTADKEAILSKSDSGSQDGQATISDISLLDFTNTENAAVNILVFTAYSDNSAGGEVENTLNAIAQYYPDFSVTLTDSENPAELGEQLQTHEILLIPEQELISSSHVSDLANNLGDTIKTYIERGGVVIACDYSWGANILLTEAHIMETGTYNIINNTALDVNPDNPLTNGMSSIFNSMSGTVYYSETNADVLVSYDGNPVSVVTRLGSGFALLMGWDYYSYDDNMAQLIANAVKEGSKLYSYNIYLDTQTPPVNLVAENYQYPVYDPGILEPSQEYFWQIEAINKCGDSISSNIWSFTTSSSISDYNGNCIVNITDFAALAWYWLDNDCENSWFRCDGLDSDRSGEIDIADLQSLAENWLQ